MRAIYRPVLLRRILASITKCFDISYNYMVDRLKRIPLWGVYGLLAYMPFHVFLSQWFSTFTGGLEVWKVAKDVMTMALVILSFALVIIIKAYKKTYYLVFAKLALAYLALHLLIYYVRKDTTFEVAALATVYNNRLLWYLGIGLSAALLTPKELSIRKITKLILIISAITVVFGLLQYALPKDLMAHFGYSIERGVKPAFFIDDKPDLPRIMSTLRDPNSLGAFLIIPILLLWQLFLESKKDRRMLFAGLLGLHGLALLLTFSRGAWAGTAVGLLFVTWLRYKLTLTAWLKRYWPIAAAAVITVAVGGYLLRDQYVIQNIIFHSDETTQAELDSNELHAESINKGLNGITNQPLGHGPGTAGVVSIQNKEGSFLTENYYIQIAYEVGILGLLIFLAVWLWVAFKLLPASTILSAGLFGACIAYAFMATLMHLWTNEAIAAQWWLLAGLALSGSRNTDNRSKRR